MVGLGVAVLWRVADDTQRERLLRTATGAASGRGLGARRHRRGARPRRRRRRAGGQRRRPGGGRRAGRRARRGRRGRAGGRAMGRPDGPRAARRAARADPLAGARRAGRARARLGRADADAHPAQRRRPARGDPAGPGRGARAAAVAVPARARRSPGRSGLRWRRRPPTSRTCTAARSRSWSSATRSVDERLGALVQAAREAMVNAAKYAADAGPVSVYAEVDEEQVSGVRARPGPGLRPGRRAGGPARASGSRSSAGWTARRPRRGRHRTRRGRGGTAVDATLVVGAAADPAAPAQAHRRRTDDGRGATAGRAGRRPPDVPHAACAPSSVTTRRHRRRGRGRRLGGRDVVARDAARRRAARRAPARRQRSRGPAPLRRRTA